MCGYASRLHSLANLLIRVQNDWLVSICCRILAVVLLTQAALLANCPGLSTVGALDAVAWLYLCLSGRPLLQARIQ